MLFSPTVLYITGGTLFIAAILFRSPLGRLLRKSYNLWLIIIITRKYLKSASVAFVGVPILFIISAIVMVKTSHRANQSAPPDVWWVSILRSPGAVFVVGMAVVTGWGFMITIKRIDDINSRFTRYDDFLVRATKLLQSEIKRSAHQIRIKSFSQVRTVRILCTTPLTGNLSERGTGYFNRYVEALNDACDFLVLKIVHSPEIQMKDFYHGFQAEERYSEEVIKIALEQTEAFLRLVEDANRSRNLQRASTQLETDRQVLPNHTLKHLWSEIGYRLMVSEDKALFFVPLYLPMEQGPIDLPVREIQKHFRVEMIGFETEEPSIIKQLIANFEWVAERSPLAGAEHQEEIETATGNINLSVMDSIPSVSMEENQAILLVHGTTGSIEDKYWKKRLQFRDKASTFGFASYEFDYRGRGQDAARDLIFSVDTATEDLNAVLKYLFEHKRHSKIWIVARGLGAYVSLASSEAKTRNCPLVFWQPIFHPDRTMAYRKHIQAYEQAYSLSEGHKYVEIENVRLHDAFFTSLKNLPLPEALAWKGIQICIFYNQEDDVTKIAWIGEFVTKLRDDSEKEAQIHYEIVGSDIRLNETSVTAYTDKTIEFLNDPRWE